MERFQRASGAPPRIYGHRGSSALEPENTMRSFARARADGADGIELDVRQCKSGELVVFHDEDLKRLTGEDRRIRDLDLAEVRSRRVRDEPIPTLDDVLDFAGDSLLVNVEIKSDGAVRSTAVAVAECLLARGLERAGYLIVSSFHPLAILAFIGRTSLPTALLYNATQALPLRRAWAAPLLGVDALHPDRVLLLAASARSLASWKLRYVVNVWTVDDPTEIRTLAERGVDGIITNDPAAARRALLQNGQ